MDSAQYDRLMAHIIRVDDAANSQHAQYRGFWARSDAGPFLVQLRRRFASKGNYTVHPKGEIVLAKMSLVDREPGYTIACTAYPGHHSWIPQSWARLVTPSDAGGQGRRRGARRREDPEVLRRRRQARSQQRDKYGRFG